MTSTTWKPRSRGRSESLVSLTYLGGRSHLQPLPHSAASLCTGSLLTYFGLPIARPQLDIVLVDICSGMRFHAACTTPYKRHTYRSEIEAESKRHSAFTNRCCRCVQPTAVSLPPAVQLWCGPVTPTLTVTPVGSSRFPQFRSRKRSHQTLQGRIRPSFPGLSVLGPLSSVPCIEAQCSFPAGKGQNSCSFCHIYFFLVGDILQCH
ncbi:hypothetical protein V8F33_000428 [Rhypophila sp. PSN 637]